MSSSGSQIMTVHSPWFRHDVTGTAREEWGTDPLPTPQEATCICLGNSLWFNVFELCLSCSLLSTWEWGRSYPKKGQKRVSLICLQNSQPKDHGIHTWEIKEGHSGNPGHRAGSTVQKARREGTAQICRCTECEKGKLQFYPSSVFIIHMGLHGSGKVCG